jgi:hypothetical protein
MNYCLDFSNRVEDELLKLISQREESSENVTLEEENELYDRALDTVLNADDGRTMAAGNVRLGEIILLVDCDTRVVSSVPEPWVFAILKGRSQKRVSIWELSRCLSVQIWPLSSTPVVS